MIIINIIIDNITVTATFFFTSRIFIQNKKNHQQKKNLNGIQPYVCDEIGMKNRRIARNNNKNTISPEFMIPVIIIIIIIIAIYHAIYRDS